MSGQKKRGNPSKNLGVLCDCCGRTTGGEMGSLGESITRLMNEKGVDAALDTPDYVLGYYLLNCLNSYEIAVREHRRWSDKHEEES